jgi:hypothetical protein
VQHGASRQVRAMRQKRESNIGLDVYISRPGHLPDVVCCHLVVGMVVQFQHKILLYRDFLTIFHLL